MANRCLAHQLLGLAVVLADVGRPVVVGRLEAVVVQMAIRGRDLRAKT